VCCLLLPRSAAPSAFTPLRAALDTLPTLPRSLWSWGHKEFQLLPCCDPDKCAEILAQHRLVLRRCWCGVTRDGLLWQQKTWCRCRLGLGSGGAGFGCGVSGGLGVCTPIARVIVMKHLLMPLKLEMDPKLQSVKYQEKVAHQDP